MNREPEIDSITVWCDTPAEGFDAIEEILSYATDVREYWMRLSNETTMEVEIDYTNPEGRQVDVDAFRPTYHEDVFVLEFGLELPED